MSINRLQLNRCIVMGIAVLLLLSIYLTVTPGPKVVQADGAIAELIAPGATMHLNSGQNYVVTAELENNTGATLTELYARIYAKQAGSPDGPDPNMGLLGQDGGWDFDADGDSTIENDDGTAGPPDDGTAEDEGTGDNAWPWVNTDDYDYDNWTEIKPALNSGSLVNDCGPLLGAMGNGEYSNDFCSFNHILLEGDEPHIKQLDPLPDGQQQTVGWSIQCIGDGDVDIRVYFWDEAHEGLISGAVRELDSACHDNLPDPADRDDNNNDGSDYIWQTESVMITQGAEQYTLEVSKSGSGTVTPDVGTHLYTDGQVVELNAVPASGWEFTGWTGSGTPAITNPGSPNTTITMDGDYSIQADFAPLTPGTIIYVNGDAAGGDCGIDWDNAFVTLQSALDIATAGQEIWVASGTYVPSVEVSGAGDRYRAFQMKNGVGIYGGFPDTGNPAWQDRDWEAFETILSGEIGDPSTKDDNCYNVFSHYCIGLDNTAIIDGFTISGGNANHEHCPECMGGGISNRDCSPTITNCRFIDNSAVMGGGICNWGGFPIITNCTFSGNLGGGICNWSFEPIIVTGCTFSGNSAGIINYSDSSPVITDCVFSGNLGPGIDNSKSSPTITNCTFFGNYGGGMSNYSSSPVLTNCTFLRNSAESGGGGMRNYNNSSPALTNCVFYGNSASSKGGGMYSDENSSPVSTNCIFWMDTSGTLTKVIDEIYGGSEIVTYSDVQVNPGSPVFPGIGNISGTPMFVNPGSGDFHLLPNSPCIDAGTNSAPNLPAEDFEGDLRIIDGIVDMGVDESPWTSWSPWFYDNNLNDKIEFGEMVAALMDYLTDGISFAHMIDVLMCYLTS